MKQAIHKLVFIIFLVLIISIGISADDLDDLITNANNNFLVICLHGYPAGDTSEGIEAADLLINNHFAPYDFFLGLRSGPYSFPMINAFTNIFRYNFYDKTKFPKNSDKYELMSDIYIEELGDFNSGSKYLPDEPGNRRQQNFISLAKCEWIYLNSPLLRIKAGDKIKKYIKVLLTEGPRFIDILVSPQYLESKIPPLENFSGSEITQLAQEFYEIATGTGAFSGTGGVPNKIRLVCHSFGGMVALRYISEPQDKYDSPEIGGFYQRHQDYTYKEYEKDITTYWDRYSELITYCKDILGYDDNKIWKDIFQFERQNSVEKVITLDSPLHGTPVYDDWGDVYDFFTDENTFKDWKNSVQACAVINTFLSMIELSFGIFLLGMPLCPPCIPWGTGLIIHGTICLGLDFFILELSDGLKWEDGCIVALDNELPFAMEDASYFHPSVPLYKEISPNSEIVRTYKYIKKIPTQEPARTDEIEIINFHSKGVPSLENTGYYKSIPFLICTGIFQPIILFKLAFLVLPSWVERSSTDDNDPHDWEYWMPLAYSLLGADWDSGNFLFPHTYASGISSGRELSVIKNNPNAYVYEVDTHTHSYSILKSIIGEDFPSRDVWESRIVREDNKWYRTNYFGLHAWMIYFLLYPILGYGTFGQLNDLIFFCDDYNNNELEISPLFRTVRRKKGYAGTDLDLTLVNKNELNNPLFKQYLSRNFFYYSMFGYFNDNKPSVIAVKKTSSFNNTIEFNLAENVSYERGLYSAQIKKEEESKILKMDALNNIIVSNYIKVFPLNITNHYPGQDIAYSINGEPFKQTTHINKIDGFFSLKEYGEYMSENEASNSSFVFDDTGNALFISPHFKEGFNNVLFRFRDPFRVEFYKDILLMQLTVPPFIKPLAPLMNQYVGSSNVECSVQALDISDAGSGSAIKPENWFSEASFIIEIDGQPVASYSTDPENFTITFNLYNLEDGNHQVDFTVKVFGLENTQSWRFWVDTTAPRVLFPEKNIFSNKEAQNSGGLQAYISDKVPFKYPVSQPVLDKPVDTVLLSHLNFQVTYENGGHICDYIDKTNLTLGAHGGSWNGWIDGFPLDHGIYNLDVTATDRVGNTGQGRGQVIIDNQGPYFNNLDVNTTLVNLNTGLLELNYNLLLDPWEESADLEVLLENIAEKEEFSLKTQGEGEKDQTYTLSYFVSGISVFKDGIYNIRVKAFDELENTSDLQGLPMVTVDRTKPGIVDAYATPFLIEQGADNIKISFTITEDDDVECNLSETLRTNVDLLDGYGTTLQPALYERYLPTDTLYEEFLAIPPDLKDGKYFLRITAEDMHENVREELVPFVKNAISPEIVFPEENEIIDGIVTIKGNVIDPRFNNNFSFGHYELYYQHGELSLPDNLTDLRSWSFSGFTVPAYQNDPQWPRNWGRFPVEGGNTFGLLNTEDLADGLITVLVIVQEEDGYRIGTTRTYRILQGGVVSYSVDIKPDPDLLGKINTFNFNQDETLSVFYTVEHSLENPVDISAFIKDDSTASIIKRLSFLDLMSNDIRGIPLLENADKGMFIYQNQGDDKFYINLKNNDLEDAGFFVIISTNQAMTGFVDESGQAIDPPSTLVDQGKRLLLNMVIEKGESYVIGFSIAPDDELSITALIDQIPAAIYLGASKQPVANTGNIVLYPGSNYPPLRWDGRDEWGRFVEKGNYTIGIEAFGKSGGYDREEILFDISTPLLLRLENISNQVFNPAIPGIEKCIVQAHTNKAASIQVSVRQETTNAHVKDIIPEPPLMENPGFFNFEWVGNNDYNQLTESGLYEFVVTATPLDGGPPQTLIIENIELNNELNLDQSIQAELLPFADARDFNGQQLIQGDSRYQIEVIPEGQYLPEKEVGITVEAKEGTQVVEAYPDLNYMAGFRTNYEELWARLFLAEVEIKYYYSISPSIVPPIGTCNMYINEIIDKNVIKYDFENNNIEKFDIISYQISFEVIVCSFFPLTSEYMVVWINKIYADVEYGKAYMNNIEINDMNIISITGPFDTNTIVKNYNITISCKVTCYVKHDNDPNTDTNNDTEFGLGDYLALTDGFAAMGPDLEDTGIYLHNTDFVNKETPVTLNNFITDPKNDTGMQPEDETEACWRQKPGYYFYYVGEDYPDLPAQGEGRNSFADDVFESYTIDNPGGGETHTGVPQISGGVDMFEISPDFSSGTFTNGKVLFTLEKDDAGYHVTVDSLAEDRIAYPYPGQRDTFNLPHTIGMDPESPIAAVMINGRRDNETPGGILPSFHVPLLRSDGEVNLTFSDDPIPHKSYTTTLAYLIDDQGPDSGYSGSFDLFDLPTSAEPVIENVNIMKWQVTEVEAEGISLDGLLGFEMTTNQIFDGDSAILFPEHVPVTISEDTSWTLLDDTVIQDSSLSSTRLALDTDTLLRTGSLPEVRIADLYSGDFPADDPENMYFIEQDLTKRDNSTVLIHEAIGGSYDINLSGLDNDPYCGLEVGDIAYFGKGLKLSDGFIIEKTAEMPKKLVAIYGRAGGNINLNYLDHNNNWKDIPIYNSNAEQDILTYWDVSELNGLCTLRLISEVNGNLNVAFKEVYVGNLINTVQEQEVLSSTGGQAEIILPRGAVSDDQIITIDTVECNQVTDIAQLPDLAPVGKIVKLQPENLLFDSTSPETLPQLHFMFHKSELENINPLELVIYQLKESGKLEALPTIKVIFNENDEPIWSSDEDNSETYPTDYAYLRAFTVLTHFSYYILLEGAPLESPDLDQDDFTTNSINIDISGKAEPLQNLKVFVLDNPLFYPQDHTPLELTDTYVDSEGSFLIHDVPLLFEGKNFIYVGYDTDKAGEYAKLVVSRDTQAPIIEIAAYDPYLSPNDDDRKDVLYLNITSSEGARLRIQIFEKANNRLVFERNMQALSDLLIPVIIDGYNFEGEVLWDGEYDIRVAAFDSVGNVALSTGNLLIIDTSAPRVYLETITPLISPQNQDGLLDAAQIELEIDESCHLTAWMGNYRDNKQKKIADNVWIEQGNTSLVWEGCDALSQFVSDGSYFLTLEALDLAGNMYTEMLYNNTVKVDNTPPKVIVAVEDNDVFVVPQILTIGFKLNELADITVLIKNEQDLTVFEHAAKYDAGEAGFIWDAPETLEDGFYKLIIEAVDIAGNIAASTIKTIELTHDITPPELYLPPDLTIEATDIFTPVDIGQATAIDESPPVIITNNTPVSFSLGKTVVTWIATDRYGNVSTATQIITIIDTTQPLLTIPEDITLEATDIQTPVDIVQAVAEDIFPVTITNDSPPFFEIGTTVVTWKAEDINGNITFATQKITIVDTTPPVLIVPEDVMVETTQICTKVDYGQATAIDIFTVTISNDAPEDFPLGTTIITWTAIDANGNISQAEQKVVIYLCILTSSKDSFIKKGPPNENEGANTILRLYGSEKNRVLVAFDIEGITILGLKKARLVLNIKESENNWSPNGRIITSHRILTEWVEGNGYNSGVKGKPDKGSGQGVTWNCAIDQDIANNKPDNDILWNGGDFAESSSPGFIHINNLTGEVSWDVTQDILVGGSFGWLIKKAEKAQNGSVDYYSKEGALQQGNMELAPKLILEYE